MIESICTRGVWKRKEWVWVVEVVDGGNVGALRGVGGYSGRDGGDKDDDGGGRVRDEMKEGRRR